MTEIAFHTGLADRIGFACRLLRKAYRRGARVLVTAPAPLLERLDRELWTFDEQDFVPHVRRRAGEPAGAQAALTPIWLAEPGALPAGDAPPVLLNLDDDPPAEPRRFERVIELVSEDAAERAAARRRWRAYEAMGLPIRHHAGTGA